MQRVNLLTYNVINKRSLASKIIFDFYGKRKILSEINFAFVHLSNSRNGLRYNFSVAICEAPSFHLSLNSRIKPGAVWFMAFSMVE